MHMNNLDAWMERRSWRVGKEEEDKKKKGKSDFSSLSFDAATVAFGFALTQQSTRGGAAIQIIFLFGSALGKGDGEGGEGIINLLLLILHGGRGAIHN